MYKKLIYLVCFVFMLGLASSASAELVAYWPLDDDANDEIGDLNWTLEGGTSFLTDSKEGSEILKAKGFRLQSFF